MPIIWRLIRVTTAVWRQNLADVFLVEGKLETAVTQLKNMLVLPKSYTGGLPSKPSIIFTNGGCPNETAPLFQPREPPGNNFPFLDWSNLRP